jgi:hypothetical protein
MIEKLYCTKCHTVWSESCWLEWKPCPFTDCDGRLSRTAPAAAVVKPRKKEPPTYPLFDAGKL